jgi:AraC-like DNA-binding protein
MGVMADDWERLLRGVGASRREGAPPWHVEAAACAHASIHVVVRGWFRLAEGPLYTLDLAPGDIVLVGPSRDAERRLHCVAPSPGELLSAVYAHAPDRDLAARAPVVHLPAGDVRRERGLSMVVGLLRGALLDPSAGQERLARSLLDPLLAYVLHGHEGALAGGGLPADPRIARALQRLRAQPAEPWTVAALAKAAGLSRAAFARRFLAEVGAPPLHHLAELRMQLAARLLAEGEASLASIAAEVGYESEFAFGRAFKRHTGEAPGAYRRRIRADHAAFRASSTRAAA